MRALLSSFPSFFIHGSVSVLHYTSVFHLTPITSRCLKGLWYRSRLSFPYFPPLKHSNFFPPFFLTSRLLYISVSHKAYYFFFVLSNYKYKLPVIFLYFFWNTERFFSHLDNFKFVLHKRLLYCILLLEHKYRLTFIFLSFSHLKDSMLFLSSSSHFSVIIYSFYTRKLFSMFLFISLSTN